MFSLDFSCSTGAGRRACHDPRSLALIFGVASALLPRDLVLGRVLEGRWSGAPLAARVAVLAVLPFAAIAVAAGSFSPFLYFQF